MNDEFIGEDNRLVMATESLRRITAVNGTAHALLESVEDQFYCPDPIVRHCNIIPDLPDIRMSAMNSVITIALEFKEQSFEHASITSYVGNAPLTMSAGSHKRYVHDLTFRFCQLSRTKLFNIEQLNNSDDSRTPDLITVLPTSVVVFEFTTTANKVQGTGPFRSYSQKVQKYCNMLEQRSNKKRLGFFVIAVAADSVCSNLPLTDLQVNALCYMYRLASAIRSGCRTQFPHLIHDDEYDSLINQYQTHIRFTSPQSYGTPSMTPEYYQKLNADFFEGDLADIEHLRKCDRYVRQQALHDLAELNSTDDPDLQRNYEKCQEAIKKHLSNIKKDVVYRYDKKNIIQFPFWNMEPTEYGDASWGKLAVNSDSDMPDIGPVADCAVFCCWWQATNRIREKSVLLDYNSTPMEDMFVDENLSKEALLELQDLMKQARSRYHRTKFEINHHHAIELAKSGVFAKRHKGDPEIQFHRYMKKQRFHYDCDTSDIDDFVKNQIDYMLEELPYKTASNQVEDLIQTSKQDHVRMGSKCQNFIDFNNRVTERYDFTRLANAMDIINDIAHELAISRNQNCESDTFIIKRLMKYKIWLLIDNTNSRSHCFYSLMCFNSDLESENPACFDTIFRNSKTNGTITWTEFSSVNDPKLVNAVRASTMMHVYRTVASEFSSGDEHKFFNKPNNNMSEHFMMFMLLFLHNKQEPCDASCNIRYVMMEGFVSEPLSPRPWKMLDKYDPTPKSRLTVNINRSVYEYMKEISKYRMKLIDGVWHNCKSWLTGQPFPHPRMCVSMSYQGYTVSKVKHLEPTNLGNVAKAICEGEDIYPTDNTALGMGDKDPEAFEFSEFSCSLLTRCIRSKQKQFKKTRGKMWREENTKSLLRKFVHGTVTEITTFKASSNYGPQWYMIPEKTFYKRDKVSTKLLEVCRRTNTPSFLAAMDYGIEQLIEDDIMHVCVFPKDQVSGIREIYVLPINVRLSQYFCETASRILCETDPTESNSNKEAKNQLPHNHFARMDNHHDPHETYGVSADKRKWNHSNNISKLARCLISFYDPALKPFFFTFFSFWEKRRIMPPAQLIQALQKVEVLHTDNEYVIKLHNAIKYGVASDICDAWCNYYMIKHGFMQGILHYLSSWAHCIAMYQFKATLYAQIRLFKRDSDSPYGIQKHVNFQVTSLLSSDDSGMLISMSYKNDVEKVRHRNIMAYFCYQMKHFMKLLAMYDSPKSTYFTKNVMEFNSKFNIEKSVEEPVVRHVNAVVHITEMESIVARQEELYTLLEQVLEFGGTFLLTAQIQVAQARYHYRCMGSSVNKYFKIYADILKMVKDPALGYFLMDDARATGALGLRYCSWINSHNTAVSTRFSQILKLSKDEKVNKSISLGLTKGGNFISYTNVLFGNREKTKREFDAAKIPHNWREKLNNNFELLFSKPLSVEDYVLTMALRYHQPGVISSFASGATTSLSSIKASGYTLQRLVVTHLDLDLVKDSENAQREKDSLIRLLRRYKCYDGDYCYWYSDDDSHLLTPSQRKVFFPHQTDYMNLQSSMNTVTNTFFGLNRTTDRRKRMKVRMYTRTDMPTVTLVDVAKWKWGLISVNAGRMSAYNSAWETYKSDFEWLSNDIHETLAKSPFEDMISMSQFICRFQADKRQLQLSCRPLSTKAGYTTLAEVIRHNYVSGMTIALDDENYIPAIETDESAKIMHDLYCIVTFPMKDLHKLTYTTRLMRSTEVIFRPELRLTPINSIYVIKQFLLRNKADFIASINQVRGSYIGSWAKRQRKIGKTWIGRGHWEGRLMGHDVVIHVDSIDHSTAIAGIEVRDRSSIMELLPVLKNWCRDNHVDVMKTVDASYEIIGEIIRTTLTGYSRGGHIKWYYRNDLGPSCYSDPAFLWDHNMLKLRFDVSAIRLQADTTTLISIPIYESNYMPWRMDSPIARSAIRGSEDMSALFSIWINNQELTIDEISNLIVKHSDFNFRAKSSWIDMIMQNSVDRMGLIDRHSKCIASTIDNEFEEEYAARGQDMVDQDVIGPDITDINEMLTQVIDNPDDICSEDFNFGGLAVMDSLDDDEISRVATSLHPITRSLFNDYLDIKEYLYSIVYDHKVNINNSTEMKLVRIINKIMNKTMEQAEWKEIEFRPRVQTVRTTRRPDLDNSNDDVDNAELLDPNEDDERFQ